MRLYLKVYKGSTENFIGYARSMLTPCKPIPLGVRYSGNIHCHINHRAGLKQSMEIVNRVSEG